MDQWSVEFGWSLKERVVASVEQGIVALDCQGRVLLANPAARSLLGLGEEVEGRSVVDLLGEVPEIVRLGTAGAGSAGPSEWQEVDALIGGRPRVLGIQAAPLAGGGSPGAPAGVVLSITDLTRSREAEAARRVAILDGLGRLGRHLAHELKNPLGALKLYVLLLERQIQQEKPDGRELVGKIARATDELSGVIDEIMTLGLPGSLERTPVALGGLIEDCLAAVSERVAALGVRVVRGGAEDLEVPADPRLLRQALRALIENALDAMPSGGTLTLSCLRAASGAATEIELLVCDTGTGMSREVQARVFEPFFSTKTRTDGTGLGMTIASHFIGLHGGRIEIRSGPGDGTVVRVALPTTAQVEDHGRRTDSGRR